MDGQQPVLPQRELRNHVSAILRAAGSGTVYTVTVDGWPVAQLGPHRPRQWVPRELVEELLATPSDPTLLADITDHDLLTDLEHDPWDRPERRTAGPGTGTGKPEP